MAGQPGRATASYADSCSTHVKTSTPIRHCLFLKRSFDCRSSIARPRPNKAAALDLLHGMSEPPDGSRERENHEGRIIGKIEGGAHGCQREIDVDAFPHDLLSRGRQFGVARRQVELSHQRLCPDVSIRIQRMAERRQRSSLCQRLPYCLTGIERVDLCDQRGDAMPGATVERSAQGR